MSQSRDSRWFQFSLRTLFLTTAALGVVAALLKAGYLVLGLVGVLPFAVGLVWGDMFPRGQKNAELIVTTPIVVGLVNCGVLFAWELNFSDNLFRAILGTVLHAGIMTVPGAIPAIAGSLVAQWLKSKPLVSEKPGVDAQ